LNPQVVEVVLRLARENPCWDYVRVRREALVRREARITEGGVRPLRLVVAAAGWEWGAA
jgi:hypothetical protein